MNSFAAVKDKQRLSSHLCRVFPVSAMQADEWVMIIPAPCSAVEERSSYVRVRMDVEEFCNFDHLGSHLEVLHHFSKCASMSFWFESCDVVNTSLCRTCCNTLSSSLSSSPTPSDEESASGIVVIL